MNRYLENTVQDTRSPDVAKKIALHLRRFHQFFREAYNHDRITTWGQRDVREWRKHLTQQFAPSTVNNHSRLRRFLVARIAFVNPLYHKV